VSRVLTTSLAVGLHVQDYRNAQNRYKNFIKGKVQRQVQIVKPDATQGAFLQALVTSSSTSPRMARHYSCAHDLLLLKDLWRRAW
jgi:hypothetical protein